MQHGYPLKYTLEEIEGCSINELIDRGVRFTIDRDFYLRKEQEQEEEDDLNDY